MTMKRGWVLIFVLVVVAVAAFAVWRNQNTQAEELSSTSLSGLSAEEIRLVLASEADPSTSGISENIETRRTFLKGMREYLALAAAARDEGMTSDPLFRTNFEYKRNLLIADLYQAELSKKNATRYLVPRETLDAVWLDPANERQFETDMATMQEIQNTLARERGENYSVGKLQGGSLAKARDNWSRALVLSEMAKKDLEFMAQPVVGLRTRILEAGILSTDYLRKHWSKIRATESEIASFLQAHPEYDVARKREKAEAILKEAMSGADFGGLAEKHSEDRATKDKGGLYQDLQEGFIWEAVEKAALEVEQGKIVERLIETDTGYHIVKLVKKPVVKKEPGGVAAKFSVQHILLQKSFEDPQNRNPDIPSPFLTANEIARAAIEGEKRNGFVAKVLLKYPIALPEDFIVETAAQ